MRRKARIAGMFHSATKDYPIFVLEHAGEEICLCQAPVGAAAATQMMDWLIGYGVREIISCGCCGVLCNLEENRFLVPYKALRDEGTSYHYMPPSRYVEINEDARMAIADTMNVHGVEHREVVTWTTDGFFRETKEKVAYRKQEGCQVVDMECSALAACAAMRGIRWGCIFFTADTLAEPDNYCERDWGRASYSLAMELSLDAVKQLS